MSESGSKSHKPIFSQTFLGAIIVAVVGGVLVWLVTDSFSKPSSSASSPPAFSSESGAGKPGPVPIPDENKTLVAGETPPGSGSTSPPVEPAPPPKKAANECPQGLKCAEGFEFLLEKCTPEGGDINCWFKVTNRRASRELRVVANRSSLDDQNDTTYDVRRVLASNGKREMVGLTLEVSANKSKRFGLNFEGLAGHVTSITLLHVRTMDFDIDWENVPVSD